MMLSDIQASIQALGYTTDTAAQQIIFINSVYRDLMGAQRWPFLEKQTTYSLAQGVYSMPLASIGTGLTHIDAVRLEDDAGQNFWNMENKEPQAFRDIQQLDMLGLCQATPAIWTIIDSSIQVYPVPNQTYTVRVDYIYQPPDLASGTDVPVFPPVYHDILVWGAICSIAYRERDWLGRQFAQSEQQQRTQRMKDEYLLRQRQTSSSVKRSGYWPDTITSPNGYTSPQNW